MIKKKEEKDKYHVFSRYAENRDDKISNGGWIYFGDYDTREDAEKDMVMEGEPSDIEFIVIKGKELKYEEGVAIYPFIILEEGEI
jgi:hypothetical protein